MASDATWSGEVAPSATALIVALALLVASCGGVEPPASTLSQASPSAAEMEEFCAAYEQVRDLSRFEMLEALVEHAPESVADVVKRASDFGGGSVDDHILVDGLLGRCDSS